ncbi:MAG: dienelactone hydrolase family protein [Solimonas sp.]
MQAVVHAPRGRLESDHTLLYLHGAGGFGTGLAGLYEYPDLPSLLREGLETGRPILMPYGETGPEWDVDRLALLLDAFAAQRGHVGCRYDVVGYSRGGNGAYRLAARDTRRVRSVTAVAARADVALAGRLAGLPVMIGHGQHDDRVPVDEARRMHEALRPYAKPAVLKLVQGDHFIIERLWRDGTIVDWLRTLAPPDR